MVLAAGVAFGETDDSSLGSTNKITTTEVKVPQVMSVRTFYSNEVHYVEIKGKVNTGNLKKYSLQSSTNLASNVWQDLCYLDECVNSKKEEFVFTYASPESSRFYRIKENK